MYLCEVRALMTSSYIPFFVMQKSQGTRMTFFQLIFFWRQNFVTRFGFFLFIFVHKWWLQWPRHALHLQARRKCIFRYRWSHLHISRWPVKKMISFLKQIATDLFANVFSPQIPKSGRCHGFGICLRIFAAYQKKPQKSWGKKCQPWLRDDSSPRGVTNSLCSSNNHFVSMLR